MANPAINAGDTGGTARGVINDLIDRQYDLPRFEDYGAVGDGVTDDTAAITAALTTASTPSFYLPPGKNYLTTSALPLVDGLTLRGEYPDEAYSYPRSTITNTTSDMWTFNGADKRAIHFEGVRFNGGTSNQWLENTVSSGYLLRWSTFRKCGIKGFQNAYKGQITGVTWSDNWVSTYNQCFYFKGADSIFSKNVLNTYDYSNIATTEFMLEFGSIVKTVVRDNFITGRGRQMPLKFRYSDGNIISGNRLDAGVIDAIGNKAIEGCCLLVQDSEGNIVTDNYLNGYISAPFSFYNAGIVVVDGSNNLIGRNTHFNLLSTSGTLVRISDAAGTGCTHTALPQIVGDSSAAAVSEMESATGTVTFTTQHFYGNVTTDGTVDGRDLATDGAKLDGIEAGADVTDAGNVEPLIDAHLNVSGAIASDVLTWNGADYTWSAASGSSYANLFENGDILELRNGTTAQSFDVFNTYATAGVDYEKIGIYWDANVAKIGFEAGGTGTARDTTFHGADELAYINMTSNGAIGVTWWNSTIDFSYRGSTAYQMRTDAFLSPTAKPLGRYNSGWGALYLDAKPHSFAAPDNDTCIIWLADGTGTDGDDGDLMITIKDSGGTVKTVTLVDFSAS